MTSPDLVEVHLLQVPVPLWQRAQQQSEALQREFALLAGDSEHDLPARLLTLIGALRTVYAAATTEQEEVLNDAADAGIETVSDLVYRVPSAAGPHARQYGWLLDEADVHCRSGKHLLTLAADEDVVQFRRWYLDQFTEQVAGRPPTAWPDYRRGSR